MEKFKNKIVTHLISEYDINPKEAQELVFNSFIHSWITEDEFWSQHMGAEYWAEVINKRLDEVRGYIGMKGKPDCELCEGTGIISSVDDWMADYIHYGEMDCDCTKTYDISLGSTFDWSFEDKECDKKYKDFI